MKIQQTKLGNKGTLIFLVLISAFPPITTDLYIPALPQMVKNFSTTESMVNMTLSIFFITYAIGLLIWGPLSEKYGRKPILMVGFLIYIASSILCAFASNIEFLILSRMIQAFGGSAVTVVATCIVKDLYDGRERAKIMATVMSLVIIAPMIAPVLGAFLLKIADWRMLFVVLAIFGVLAALVSLLFEETLTTKYNGSIIRSWGRIGIVLNNRKFIILLVIFSIVPMSLLSFLAAGSYIYISVFGLSEQQFSFAFAFNALCASMGPILYIKISKYISVQNIISFCFAVMACCGVMILTLGAQSLWLFVLMMALATMSGIVVRVPGMNLMLDQQQFDTGSASALIQFWSMILGAVGMMLVSLTPDDLIHSIGLIQCSVGITAGILWLLVRNRPFVHDNIVKLQE